MTPTVTRAEDGILADLQALCTAPGYVHALAYLCVRDNVLVYGDAVSEADIRELSDPTRLSRTEMNTLIGLMVKAPIDWSIPAPQTLESYVDASDRLLEELHRALSAAFSLNDLISRLERGEQINPFASGSAMREPIFYAAESAYDFQYLELAARRYAADADWLLAHVGFTIAQACAVAKAIDRVHADRFQSVQDDLPAVQPDQWTMLPAFCFTPAEVATVAGFAPDLVERILLAFTLSEGERNARFASLQDFNAVTATPLLRLPGDEFVSLQRYALAEAIYDSPFYWMLPDKNYRPQRDRHRGEFAEHFVAERLATVFGADRVFTNVDIWLSKGIRYAEIDVLVLWADRAIIVQAKSKRLTLEARKGHDQVIRDDFKKSVQDAYDQGMQCAAYLGDQRFRLTRADGSDVALPNTIGEIFVFCVVSDHYPALSFQTQQFLKPKALPRVQAALVTDVFLIDVLTELLSTPLQFLSYVARRARYADRLLAAQELTILGYHLKQNLWFDDKMSMIHIAEDFTAGVDIAMAARRAGLAGPATPDGVLTRYKGTTLGRIIHQIESRPHSAVLDQGFQLLELSDEAIDDLNRMIDRQARRAAQDGQPHDVTWMFPDGSGLTVLCTDEPLAATVHKLKAYCLRRKYAQKASLWFGMCLTSGRAELRFGFRISTPWVQDDTLDAATASMATPVAPATPMATPNCSTYGRSNCSRQDGQIMTVQA